MEENFSPTRSSTDARSPLRSSMDARSPPPHGKTREIADRLVAPSTINRAAKVSANAKSEDPRLLDVDAANAPTIVLPMLKTFLKELSYDADMARSYRKFCVFLFYAIVLLVVISMQRHVGEVSIREQFLALEDQYFSFGEGLTRNTAQESSDRMEDFTHVLDHLRDVVLPAIFRENDCGNGACDRPDEYPTWDPGSEARRFGGCGADCGVVDTANVTVRFYDPWKLKQAVDLMTALSQESSVDGYTPAEWGVVDGNGELISQPSAGWNICHKTDKEQGFLTTVCVFDANITIDTLPFRAEELNVSSSLFGNSKTVSLYEGEWELRIGYQNFAWTHPETGVDVHFAFPAVRGEICVEDALTGEEDCTPWDPCPDADECACEYVENEYVCYDDKFWSTFNVTTMLHDPPPSATYLRERPEFAAYHYDYSIKAIGEWWRVQRPPEQTSWTERGPPLSLSEDRAAGWSPNCHEYSLFLLHPDVGEGRWDTADYLEIWASSSSILDLNSTQQERHDAREAKAYSFTFDDDTVGCASKTVLLCDDRQYVFGVAPREDGMYETRGEAMAYALTNSNGEIVFRGNAAWTYAQKNSSVGFECPGGTFQRHSTCFDQNRSYCVWNVNQDTSAYCDPTEDYTEQEKTIYEFGADELDFSSSGHREFSGKYCEPVTDCDRYIRTYSGLTEAVACDIESVNSWETSATVSTSTTLGSSELGTDSIDWVSLPLADEARHVACAFSESLCGWSTQDSGWRWNHGTTPTDWTGPSADGDPDYHQTYAYVESTGSALVDDTYFLEHINFTLSQAAVFTFDFHMYGHRMGSLTVQSLVNANSSTVDDQDVKAIWKDIWRIEFNQMPRWHRDVAVVLEPGTIGLRFAVNAIHQTGDIAIDNVAIRTLAGLDDATEVPTSFAVSEDEICTNFFMFNDDGVGWAGASYHIVGPNQFETSGTISDGESWQVDIICFEPRSGCYSLEVTEGTSDARRHWELVVPTEMKGEYAPLSGRAPDTRSFQVGNDVIETDCTLAPTFSPHPTVSPAPTCATRLLVEMSDSYGDGYDGAAFTLSDDANQEIATGTLEDGPYVLQTVCLPEVSKCYMFSVSEDNTPSDVSWQVSLRLDDENLLNGSAPFTGAIFVNSDGVSGGGGATCAEAMASAAAEQSSITATPATDDDDNDATDLQTTIDPSTTSAGTLSCYASWRVAQSTGSENFWTREPGEVVTCTAQDDSCVMVEYEWPPTEMEEYFAIAVEKGYYPSRPNETLSFVGLGGCKSEFSVQSASPWSDCVSQTWWGFAPPSSCIECDTNLCNVRPLESQPTWYSNSFGVSAVSLYHSMDWIVDTDSEIEVDQSVHLSFLSPDRYETCPAFSVLDDICDITFNTLGCNYDNFACCNDARTGCSAPWYQRQDIGELDEDDEEKQELQAKWIYSFTTEDEIHATVPHSLRSVVKEKILLHTVGDPSDSDQVTWAEAEKNLGNNIPSLSCPECSNVPESGWRAINFNVSVPWIEATSGNPNNNSMFPTKQKSDMRIRFFSSPNIVLYGPMLTQIRGELKQCPTGKLDGGRLGGGGDRSKFIEGLRDNLDRLNLGCLTNVDRLLKRTEDDDGLIEEDTSQFGIDPTFQFESDLYRPGNDVDELYEVEEIRSDSQIPYLFQQRMERFGTESKVYKTKHVEFVWSLQQQKYPHSYPVIFDVNTNVSRAYEILETLVEGGYFDEATDMAFLTLFLFNPQTETFSLISSTFTAGKSGAVLTDHEIVIVDVSYYSTAVDLCRFLLECVALTLLVLLVYVELFEMFETAREFGTLVPYFMDLSNLVDFAGYAFQIALVPLWVCVVTRCNRFTPAANYDVHDELAEGRIVMAQPGTHRAQKAIDELSAINESVREYELFGTLSIIMLAMQCLKSLRFHPTFGLVTQTIVKMANKVFFWFILLCLVLGCYAVLGSLLFGHENGDYSTVSTAAITLLAALSGMYDYSTLPLTDTTAQIYFWTYMFIAFFVLLNVLLAIIVEAFDSSVVSLQRRDPLRFFVGATFGCTRARKCLLPASTMVKILNKAVRLIDDQEHQVDIAARTLSFLQRRSSKERVTHDSLVALLATLPRLHGAIDSLPAWEKDADIKSVTYDWKPAIDEDLIALDYPLVHLALRTVTPDAGEDDQLLVDVWAVVALNIMIRFGNERNLHRDSGEDEAKLTAAARLLEIHRIVDVEAAARSPGTDVMRTMACCYNYQQNRCDSLIELARDIFDEQQHNEYDVVDDQAALYNDIVASLAKARHRGDIAILKSVRESLLDTNLNEESPLSNTAKIHSTEEVEEKP